MSSALARLAEDPSSSRPTEGAERIVNDRYCVDDRLGAALGRRLPSADRGRSGCRSCSTGEILDCRDIERTFWNVGRRRAAVSPRKSARARLARTRPPWDPVVAAMVLAEDPPKRRHRIRRIETFGEHLAGLEIMLRPGRLSEEARRGASGGTADVRARMRRGGCSGSLASTTSRSRSRLPIGARRPVPRRGRHAPWRGAAGVQGSRPRPAGTRRSRSACRPRGAGAVHFVRADPAAARIR